ncbi:MAG TPA: VOC family protein [Pyrinomonadaceae bacterium]|nr:VOC family protein [Pyrinomonadaceae bacterium]
MVPQPIREGFQSVVPFLSVQGAASLVEFLCAGLGAKQIFESKRGTHFEVRIGDSMVMIGDVGNGAPTTGQLFMYVEDADASYKRAIQAGATSIMELSQRPWGEGEEMLLAAAVKDPCGNLWFFAGPQ